MGAFRYRHSSRAICLLASVAALPALGCGGDDEPGAANGAAGSAGSAGAAGSGGGGGDECTIVVEPGDDDTAAVQGALIDAGAGDTVCLSPGTYRFERKLNMAGTADVTLRGNGASRDDVILDFAEQDDGDDAMTVQADGFTIENLTVKDPPGDGVKITRSDRPTFRNIRAYWSAGSVSENGTYALYPAECTNVLVEDCEVSNAADAGIYLGQSTTGIVRRNKAHGNVIGIEVENSEDVEVYDNEAWDNTCGFLIVNLPNLIRKSNRRVLVRDNIARENDLENFGPPGAFVEAVPAGTGILVMASGEVEIRNNVVEGNDSVGLMIGSWPTMAVIGGFPANDPEFEQYTETVYVHGNSFEGNGARPMDVYATLGFEPPVEAIVWDGFVDEDADASTADARRICIQDNDGGTFRNINVPEVLSNQSTDLEPHDCSHPALPEVTLD